MITSATPQRARILATLLLLVPIAISGYLLVQTWLDAPIAGCSEEASCQLVLTSKWAFIAGVPVSLLGLLSYGSLVAISIVQMKRSSHTLCRLEFANALLIILAAAWFSFVQISLLHAFCPWCCCAHILAVIASFILIRFQLQERSKIPSTRPALLRPETLTPLCLVLGLILFQSSANPPEHYRTSQLPSNAQVTTLNQKISVYDGKFTIDPSQFPHMGSPTAKQSMIILTDYTCPHCRSLYHTLDELVQQQGGDISVVLLPAYRDPAAKEVHRIMLTLWKDNIDTFETISSKILSEEIQATPQAVLAAAQNLTTNNFYESAWRHADWVGQSLQLSSEILASNDQELESPTLPQIMIGAQILQGNPNVKTLTAQLSPSPTQHIATTAPTTPAATTSGPSSLGSDAVAKIEFPPPSAPARVIRGEKHTQTFTFTNTGSAPLKILGVKTSCGCTKVGGWKQTVAPGEQGNFKVSLDTSRFIGSISKPVTLTTNASNVRGGVTSLKVKANVWLPVALSKLKANFGVILTGQTAQDISITMKTADEGPFKIEAPTCDNAYFNILWQETIPNKEFLLTVSIPKIHRKMEQGEITIPLGHLEYPILKIPILARMADAIEASPNSLKLPPTPLKSPDKRIITVRCHDRAFKDFSIIDAKAIGLEGVSVKVKKAHSKRWQQIEISFPKKFSPSPNQKPSIQVQTSHPEFRTLTIPINTQKVVAK
jgi:uncharacterized membrane protein